MKESNKSFQMELLIAIIDNDEIQKLIRFCCGRVTILVHPSLYKVLNLKFNWNIGGLSQDDTIKTGMSVGFM